ncbi:hypothetical protein DP117_01260 [Brasilonema sp. UFV-L1]|nr:hypothetical protein [Brasilonema sp. UFV-L1]
MCIHQAIVKDSAVTLFLFPTTTTVKQATKQRIVSLLRQRVYLFKNYSDTPLSGIGAFYDNETQEFLKTKERLTFCNGN